MLVQECLATLCPIKLALAFLARPRSVQRSCQSTFNSWLELLCIPCIRPTTNNASQSLHFGQVLSVARASMPQPQVDRNCDSSCCPYVCISGRFCLFSTQRTGATFLYEGSLPTTMKNGKFCPLALL